MNYKRICTNFCPYMGFCANNNNGECKGFSPMNSEFLDDEDCDPMEEKLERTTY